MLESLLLKLSEGEHLPEPLPADPMPLFMQWFDEGMRDSSAPMPDAMALATSSADAVPSVRFVLCKKIEPSGALHFFTNFESRKSAELTENPLASGAFYWPATARQARVEGHVERLTDAESDAYFATRSLAARIGAWASRQSRPLESREQFIRDLFDACKHLHIDPSAILQADSPLQVSRPPHWGGFRLRIARMELWCGAEGRLHDRAVWTRDVPATHDPAPDRWKAVRLYP